MKTKALWLVYPLLSSTLLLFVASHAYSQASGVSYCSGSACDPSNGGYVDPYTSDFVRGGVYNVKGNSYAHMHWANFPTTLHWYQCSFGTTIGSMQHGCTGRNFGNQSSDSGAAYDNYDNFPNGNIICNYVTDGAASADVAWSNFFNNNGPLPDSFKAGFAVCWQKGTLPMAKAWFGGTVVNNTFLAVGGGICNGCSGFGGSEVASVEAYDAAAQVWLNKVPLASPRFDLSAATAGTIVYAIGGTYSYFSTPVSTVEAYDSSSDTWSGKNSMPTARWKLTSATVNGRVYAIGGGPSGNQGQSTNAVEEYDPGNDTWTSKAPMPTARYGAASDVINNQIYVVGGLSAFPTSGLFAVLEVYDPATDSWLARAPMSAARMDLAAAATNGKLYAIGGWDTQNRKALQFVEEYDPATDTWLVKAPMPTARSGLAAVTINGKIYAFGGSNETTVLNVLEVYDPQTDTWTTGAPAPPPTVLSVSPANGTQSQTIPNFTVTGTNFNPKATLSFSGTGITPKVPYTSVTPTQLITDLTIDPGAPVGAQDVIVTNSDGQKGTLPGGFTVLAGQPAINISPTQITFPPTAIQTTSAPVTVTVSNPGTAALLISDISAQGPFKIINFSQNIGNVQPGTTATFDMIFSPMVPGSFSGSATITSNAPNSPTVIPLQGVGVTNGGAPSVSLSPPFLVFPSQAVNTTSDPMVVTVTNAGSATLHFSAVPAIIGFNASDFAVASGTTCIQDADVAPGNSCAVDVVFTPLTALWEVATLLLLDNAGYGSQTVPLTSGGQLISISPDPVPGSGSPQTVTIAGTNFAAGGTINWQNLTGVTTGNIKNPQVISSSTMTASLPFTDASAIWQIEVVNPGKPMTTSNWYPFQVTGTGSATPAFLDDYPFKNAPVDQLDPYGFHAFGECTSYVAWKMNRDAAITDTGDPITSNPAFFKTMAGGYWGDATNWGLNAGKLGYKSDLSPEVGDIARWAKGHVAYVERVNPDKSVDVSEYNYNWPNDDNIKYQYGVRHLTSGYFPDEFIHIRRLSLSLTSLDFGSRAVGTSGSQTITVTNSLAQTISLQVTVGASRQGIGTGDFTQSGTCGDTSLSPGAQCEITVSFTPTVGSARSAAIALNWGAGPQLVPVKGVGLKTTTTITLLSSINPSVSGKPVSFTVNVSSSWGTPTGEVEFLNGTTVLATLKLTSGSAKYTTPKLLPGSNSITAVYEGDSNNSGSTSAPVIQLVLAVTTTTLTTPSPSTYGQTVIFTATVTSIIGAPPDGETVTFKQGATLLGAVTLSGGNATFSISTLGVGTHSITAVYSGDFNFASSTSKAVSQGISKATSTTTPTSSQNPSTSGQPVTFTATVAPQFSGTPTGSVVFKDGTKTLKTMMLSGGVASYATSTLTSGTHNITTTYNGSTSFTGSSASLTQTVN